MQGRFGTGVAQEAGRAGTTGALPGDCTELLKAGASALAASARADSPRDLHDRALRQLHTCAAVPQMCTTVRYRRVEGAAFSTQPHKLVASGL